MIICNPNNPLGSDLSSNYLDRLVALCNESNIPIIIDETYHEFNGNNCSNLIKNYENLIIIRTFSKFFGLAGLRLGYVLSNPYLIKQMLKIRSPWDINSIAIILGEYCLHNKQAIYQIMEQLNDAKIYLLDILERYDIQVYKTTTNFILVKDNSKKYLYSLFKKNNILTNDLSLHPYSFNLLTNVLRIAVPPLELCKMITKILSHSRSKTRLYHPL